MRTPPCHRLSSMSSYRNILGCVGAAHHGQTGVDEPICTIVGFGFCTQEGVTNSHQRAADSSKMWRPTAKARRLCGQFDKSDAHCHHMRILLRSMQNTLGYKESEFRPLVVEYYLLTNECHRLPSDTCY